MSLTAIIKALVDAGATSEMLLAAVTAYEATAQQDIARIREVDAARSRRYRERGGGSIPPEMRHAVFERDGHRCIYCGSSDHLQADHDQPVSKGGETTLENLVTACRVCNAKKKDRDRKAFVRALSKEIPRTNVESEDPPLEAKGVPAPLPKTQNPTTPPIVPPAAQIAADVVEALAEEIWSMQPKAYRRTAKPDVLKATRAALRRGGKPDEMRQGCRTYYARPDCREDDGRFAKGAGVLLAADRWREYLPRPEPPKAVTPQARAMLVQHFRDTGEWQSDWGPVPDEQAA